MFIVPDLKQSTDIPMHQLMPPDEDTRTLGGEIQQIFKYYKLSHPGQLQFKNVYVNPVKVRQLVNFDRLPYWSGNS